MNASLLTLNPAQIYPASFNKLEEIIVSIQENRIIEAQKLLNDFFETIADTSIEPETQQVRLFADAIRKRFEGKSYTTPNFYLMPDQGQQIRLFNFMAQKFSVVQIAHDIAIKSLVSFVLQRKSFILLDIGIGTAQLEVKLIENLAKLKSLPERLTVIAVEPLETSLKQAQLNLEKVANHHGIQFEFFQIHKSIEDLSQQEWQYLRTKTINESLLINAAFSIHHIRPGDMEKRISILKKLKKLQPQAFMLIEPYSDHYSPNVLQRFANAWQHYGLTFRVIDTIEAPEEDKAAVKAIFFGREIQDVLAKGGCSVEQLETAEMWLDKLKEAGFFPYSLNHQNLKSYDTEIINLSQKKDYIGVDVDGYTILAIMCLR